MTYDKVLFLIAVFKICVAAYSCNHLQAGGNLVKWSNVTVENTVGYSSMSRLQTCQDCLLELSYSYITKHLSTHLYDLDWGCFQMSMKMWPHLFPCCSPLPLLSTSLPSLPGCAGIPFGPMWKYLCSVKEEINVLIPRTKYKCNFTDGKVDSEENTWDHCAFLFERKNTFFPLIVSFWRLRCLKACSCLNMS